MRLPSSCLGACFAFVVLVAAACDDSQVPTIPTRGPFLLAGQDCDSLGSAAADGKHIAFGATTLVIAPSPAFKALRDNLPSQDFSV